MKEIKTVAVIIKRLRELRLRAGMSQNELARKSGVGRDTISKAEGFSKTKEPAITDAKAHALINGLNDGYYAPRGETLDPSAEISEYTGPTEGDAAAE